MRARDLAVRLAQLMLATLVVWLAWRELLPHWEEVRRARATMVLRWSWIAASAGLVLVSYAVLIQTWRRTVARWGHPLSVPTAARIWFVSNLGKYVPGKIWQITAMGAMAREAGVPATAAIGSSLLIAVVNVLAGGLVVLLAAYDADLLPPAATIIGAVLISSAVLLPRVIPQAAARIARWRGREILWPALSVGDVLVLFVGCAVAWCLYGIAFQWLAWGTLGEASGATRYYIASFTVSYLAGFLALVAPGGVGVREIGVLTLLPQFGLTTVGGAALLAVISRLWLTILELLPGLVLLLTRSPRSAASSTE
jgi:glycosyltransferase 2 family protein